MKRKRRNKHFICRYCDQSKEAPVRGKPHVGKPVMICPGCRGIV